MAEVFQNMTGTTGAAWNDPVKGGELAKSQFDRGADVVYHAAGGTGIGVLQAAADAGKLGIGVDSNQNGLHPGKVLTSMLKRVDVATYNVFKAGQDGSLQAGRHRAWARRRRRRLGARRQQQGADHARDEGGGGQGGGRYQGRHGPGPRLYGGFRLPLLIGLLSMSDRTAMAAPSAIALAHIDKRFGAVHANKDISLEIEKGTIHGIVGENGAGKSTLMSILFGFYQADSGEIRVDGKATEDRHARPMRSRPASAWCISISCWSANSPCSRMSCSAPKGASFSIAASARRGANWSGSASDYGLQVDPDALIDDLPVGLQQRVEILKALYRGAEVLILDEPTGVLTPSEAEHLFRILRQLKGQGKTIVLITHKLKEIMAVTDRVSVMRRGEMVATLETQGHVARTTCRAHGRKARAAARGQVGAQARAHGARCEKSCGQGLRRNREGR